MLKKNMPLENQGQYTPGLTPRKSAFVEHADYFDSNGLAINQDAVNFVIGIYQQALRHFVDSMMVMSSNEQITLKLEIGGSFPQGKGRLGIFPDGFLLATIQNKAGNNIKHKNKGVDEINASRLPSDIDIQYRYETTAELTGEQKWRKIEDNIRNFCQRIFERYGVFIHAHAFPHPERNMSFQLIEQMTWNKLLNLYDPSKQSGPRT